MSISSDFLSVLVLVAIAHGTLSLSLPCMGRKPCYCN